MANLKDLIVNGATRVIGKVYSSGGFVGNLEGTSTNANYTATSTPTTASLKNIQMSTTDLTAGSSALATGTVYIVYE